MRVARAVADGAVAVALFPWIFARAMLVRREPQPERPRVLWGVTPLISLKYWSESVRRRGFDSKTVVIGVYSINRRSDFDVVVERGGLRGLVRPYLAFARYLNRDVHVLFFDGGFLANTVLAPLEGPLLRLARRRLVLVPYGSDIAVPGMLGPLEGPLRMQYSILFERAETTRRRIDRLTRSADVVVRNVQPGYLPRWDVLWPAQLAIDTDEWAPSEPPKGVEVVVAHASNHRSVKGTDALITAVELLRAEGAPIRLELVEGRLNSDVREVFRHADVVAEQFLIGYGMTAVEGMASGRPVLSNLSSLPPEVRADDALRDCPIVDTNVDTIADRLRELVADPRLREDLGRRGREYVLRFHSYEAVGAMWEAIFRHLWSGTPLPRSIAEVSSPQARLEVPS